jgi:hypothetical protein
LIKKSGAAGLSLELDDFVPFLLGLAGRQVSFRERVSANVGEIFLSGVVAAKGVLRIRRRDGWGRAKLSSGGNGKVFRGRVQTLRVVFSGVERVADVKVQNRRFSFEMNRKPQK